MPSSLDHLQQHHGDFEHFRELMSALLPITSMPCGGGSGTHYRHRRDRASSISAPDQETSTMSAHTLSSGRLSAVEVLRQC